MNNLSSLLRRLADIVDANGGEVPESLFDTRKDDLRIENQKGKQSKKEFARSLVRKHLYGMD